MNCKQAHKLLPGYIEHKLSIKQSEHVRLHLENCSKCTKLYAELHKSLDFLKPKSEISEQPFYYTKLKQRMENDLDTKGFVFNPTLLKRIIQPVAYLASIVFAVYIGILIGSNSSVPNQYSKFETNNNDYIEEFAEYSYLNDVEMEPLENLFLVDSNAVE